MASFRRAFAIAVLALAALLARAEEARASSDPSLRWYTIETPHFRVTYHSGLEAVAQHVANVAESVEGDLAVHVGHRPREITEIGLSDFSESANGVATAIPYNAVRLLVTAPEDMSALGDVDDWQLELVTHEQTHIHHTDNIRGLPALVNSVLGKTLAPNHYQPRWILEGLGVYHESARTTGGRLRNSMWDMFMRTDVLANNVAGIDQISAFVRRWPQGNLFYLYGAYFSAWIAQTYGEEALRAAATDYGGQLIPWGFNRSMRRATGKTYVELYPEWIASLRERYAAQAAEVRARGIREGTRLTHHGQIARYPRWIPKGAWPEHQGGILYFRQDERLRPGLWALPLVRNAKGDVIGAVEKKTEHVARAAGESYASFLPDGGVVFSSQDWYKNVFLYNVLEKMEPGRRSSFGIGDGGRTQIAPPSMRASDPTTSPDGRRVVFNVNRAGTRSIHIADLEESAVSNARPLVPTAFLEQAFTPRWSPDGSHVAYSVWKRGGFRDIRLVDVRDGSSRDVTSDRAIDGSPSFSPDGRYLLFHSDRTGIMNVYALELATDRLRQVTNVVSGAYSPEVSPDGKTLAYVGYTKDGFDLYAMPFDESAWTDATPYVDAHPPMPPISTKKYPVVPYSPWRTLAPRRYSIEITPGNFGGQAVIASVAATDITGLHSFSASSVTEFEKPEPQGSIAYAYARLPFDFSVSLFRSITPRGGYQIGERFRPTVVQETAGLTSSIAVGRPSTYESRIYSISHSLARVGAEYPFPAEALDPYETPIIPPRGTASTLSLGYVYSNAERYLWSVGFERGYTLSTSVGLTDPALGSDFSGFSASGDLTTYWLMPWLRHHSLAIHVGGGTSGGTLPGRGAFFVGGFVDLPVVDTLRNFLVQGGFTLRGYPTVALAGRSYALANAEYRFPIVNIDRGPSTLPMFLNRITGAFFVDYGSAFEQFRDAPFKTGVGSELWFDFTLGYAAPFTFRLGYARGLASLGIDKIYWVAAVPF